MLGISSRLFFLETYHFCFTLALRSSSKTKVNDWTMSLLIYIPISLIKCTLILLLFSRKFKINKYVSQSLLRGKCFNPDNTFSVTPKIFLHFIQYLLFTVSYPSSGWGCLTTVKGCTSELWGPNSYSRFLLESVSPGVNACAAVVKGYRVLLGWGLLPIKKWNAVWGVGFFPSYFSFSGRGLELCLIETKETRITVHKKSLSSESTGRGWTPAALSCLHSLNK